MAVEIKRIKIVVEADDSGVKSTEKGIAELDKTVEGLGTRIDSVMRALSAVPLFEFGKKAFDAAAKMDSLKRALTAVSGSAEETERQLTRLQEVAKLPGLGFAEAVQGSVRLQAAGLSAAQAEKSLSAFGNAIATVGKGKESLDYVTLALSQMSAKGKVMGDDLRQIAEQVPQIRQIMVQAFGTADTEILQKAGITASEYISIVTGELSKLPAVTGGIANDVENLNDSMEKSFARIGDSIARVAGPQMQKFADTIEYLTTKFSELPKQTQDIITILGILAAASGPVALLANQFTLLAGAIGASQVAMLGPAGLIGGLTLLGGLTLADLFNKDSDAKAIAAESTAFEDLSRQLEELSKQRQKIFDDAASRYKARNPSGDPAYAYAMGSMLSPAESSGVAGLDSQIKDLERRVRSAFVNLELKKSLGADPEFESDMQGFAGYAQRMEVRRKIEAASHAKALEAAKKHAEALAKIRADLSEEIVKLTKSEWDAERYQMAQKITELRKAGVTEVEIAKWKAATLKSIAEKQFEEAQARLTKFQKHVDTVGAYNADKEVNRRLAGIAAMSGGGISGIPESIGVDFLPTGNRKDAFGYNAGRNYDMTRYKTEMQESKREVAASIRQREALIRDLTTMAQNHSTRFLEALMGAKSPGARLAAITGLFNDFKSLAISTLSTVITDALKPQLTDLMKSLVSTLRGDLGSVMQIMGQYLLSVVSSVYALLAASQRKKKFGWGSAIGTVVGFLAGGPAGAVAGYNIGGAVDNGDWQGAVVGTITSSASGTWNPANSVNLGTQDYGQVGRSASVGTKDSEMVTRGVHVTQNVYGGIHNAADLHQLMTGTTQSVRMGLRSNA